MSTGTSRLRTLLLPIACALLCATTAAAGDRPAHSDFIVRDGSKLFERGNLFRFAGANNYYPMYKSQRMVDAFLDRAIENEFKVLRVWASLEIGNQDGSNSVDGPAEGVYFQYWDGSAPAFNDGENGLRRLDYIVWQAGERGLRLTLPLVNNWNNFGGMDQYVRWRGGQFHDQFFTDATIKGWYRDWISHLLNRVNHYSGVRYKDDPTIMMWELGNEPRCVSSGAYPRSPDCSTATLIAWADEMSAFIKSIDPNHLVSVGDEGFLCLPDPQHWTEGCGDGVDSYAFAALPNIDAMSVHLYPDHWGTSAAWGTEWIRRHAAKAHELGKAVYVGEYGWLDKATRNPVFRDWTDAAFFEHVSGAMYWILSDVDDTGALYPDYDGFTVYCPSPVCTTLNNFAARMTDLSPWNYPPVADHDSIVTPFGTPVSFNPTVNDITYGNRQFVNTTIDLDPVRPRRQSRVTGPSGTFVVNSAGNVTFEPAADFQGVAQVSYTIADDRQERSNVATVRVQVQPSATGAQLLYSFESDAEGWAPANWQANAGIATHDTAFATQGAASLQIAAVDGGWFGLNVPGTLDIASRASLRFDLRTLPTGTSTNVAIQGRNWTWCEGSWGFQDPESTATVEIPLSGLTANGAACPIDDFTDVNAIWVFVSAGVTVNIDNVRAE